MQSKLFEVVFRRSLIIIITHPLIYYFDLLFLRCYHFDLVLCPGDAILMVILLNISAGFDSYLSLIINIILLGFEKYRSLAQHPKDISTNLAVSIIFLRWLNHQQKLSFYELFQDNNSLDVSRVVLMLFHKLPLHLALPV